jgi:hypothetical protein
MYLDRVTLWVFPESDFAAWRELIGAPHVDDYASYLTMLAAIQADQEWQGRKVVRVQMSVAEMIDALADHGWANSPDNRAAIVGLRG